MNKARVIILILLLVPVLAMIIYTGSSESRTESDFIFNQYLSEYELFQGDMSKLIPSENIEIIELQSSLFTDYTEKQRIIKLPENQKITANGNGLPLFPDGTIIAKTFYYPKTTKNNNRHLLETRLLIKKNSVWNATTYQWTEKQDDAVLIEKGATIPVTFIDETGKTREVNYKVPTKFDCIICHQHHNEILPIGPKLRNINLNVIRENEKINQLEYLKNKGFLEISNIKEISSMGNYNDLSLSTEERVRAYFDINCAHCHSPQGMANIINMDFRFETPYNKTGIWMKTGKIASRMSVMGELHMPKIGTTIIHDEGVELVLEYIKNLK